MSWDGSNNHDQYLAQGAAIPYGMCIGDRESLLGNGNGFKQVGKRYMINPEYKIPHQKSPIARDYELVFTIIVTFTTFDEGIFFRSNSEIL
jgi:hypothetical protein